MGTKKSTQNLINSLKIDLSTTVKIAEELGRYGVRKSTFQITSYEVEYYNTNNRTLSDVNLLFTKVFGDGLKKAIVCDATIVVSEFKCRYVIRVRGIITGEYEDDYEIDNILMNSIYSFIASAVEKDEFFNRLVKPILLPENLKACKTEKPGWEQVIQKGYYYDMENVSKIQEKRPIVTDEVFTGKYPRSVSTIN